MKINAKTFYVHVSEDNVGKMAILTQLIYRFDVIPINLTLGFFAKIDKLIIKFIWRFEKTRRVKIILEKKNKVVS